VVVFKDGLISSADYQKMSRCLTWIKGKSRADIIRVSFSALGLAENLFLIEHESIVNETHETQISKGHRFFEGCNAFTSYDMSKTGKVTAKNALDVEIIIENMIKHARETEYTLAKFWDADIVVDIDAGKVTEDPSITRSNKTAPETKLSDTKADEEPKVKEISDSDRMKYLRTQSIIVQVLPLILDTKFNVQSVDDIGIIDEDEFNQATRLNKAIFEVNLDNRGFRNAVDLAFRNSLIYTDSEMQAKMQDYCAIEYKK
jgi:hypothetical protein